MDMATAATRIMTMMTGTTHVIDGTMVEDMTGTGMPTAVNMKMMTDMIMAMATMDMVSRKANYLKKRKTTRKKKTTKTNMIS